MSRETVLITGASSGIGGELAKLFAADGSSLVLVARREDRLQKLAQELRDEHGTDARVLPGDLAQGYTPDRLCEQLCAHGIAVDVLVNNAGFGARGAVADLPLERQVELIQVNVTALTHLTRLLLPGMLERHRGAILNLSSTAGFQPGPNMAVYYASKAYVLSFTEGLAEELSGTGVTATCLCPGPTATEFAAGAGMESSRLFRLGAMDQATVARAGYRGLRRGDVVVVPGARNRAMAASVRFAPRALVRKLVHALQG
jgi:short-subunit dehydrogenase